jgi:hypothetical protein
MKYTTRYLLKYTLLIAVLCMLPGVSQAQSVYKTPSGEKYHLSTCHMVENVSKKLVGVSDIEEHSLEPCKICKPPAKANLVSSLDKADKSVGEGASVQCKGITQSGTRCKHLTRIANGYCFQHTSQNSSLGTATRQADVSAACGARTQAGGYCKRIVTGGGRCYQHQ